MDFIAKQEDADKIKTACVVVGVFSPKRLSEAAERLDKASRGQLSELLKSGDIDTSCGSLTLIHQPKGRVTAERILVVGCGHKKKLNEKAFLSVTQNAAKKLNKSTVREAVSFLPQLEVNDRSLDWKCRQTALTSGNTVYRYDETKSDSKPPKHPLRKLAIGLTKDDDLKGVRSSLSQGKAIAAGMALARHLGNLPANYCTPSDLAETALDLGKQHSNLKVSVLEERDMEKLGMGSLLSVSRGSRQPAKLITLQYTGGQKDDQPVVLVGKGVTFDSGGISIKPGAAMDEMKFDMCGAASVFGTLSACAEMALPINVIGLVPATENLPDGDASKPGDVVTSMSGQTIEVLNTDAEGRLILCDALTYAERFNPEVVIDIATLTGACIVALGHQTTALLGNDQPLADELLDAGQTACDRAWQLPLWEEYDKQLSSNFADMGNMGGRGAGSHHRRLFSRAALPKTTVGHIWT